MAKVINRHQWSTAWTLKLERLGLLKRGAISSVSRQRVRIKRIEALTGRVHAEVQDQTKGTCQITLKFAPLTERAWLQLVDSIETQLQNNAQRNVDELLREAGPFFTDISTLLLPSQADDLHLECSCCGSATTPCPACEMVYRQVGAMLDEEPILLLRLRGREWQALQQALQARRTTDYLGGLPAAGTPPIGAANGDPALSPQTAQPADAGQTLERRIDHFWGSRKALESLHYYIAPPMIELALLRRLGPLPATLNEQGTNGTPALNERALQEQDLYQEMAKIYRQVTVEAQALAYSLDTSDQSKDQSKEQTNEPANGSERHAPEAR